MHLQLPKATTQPNAPDPANVVIFGETGAGKSSVINMIVGEEVAETSGSATGCTFESKPHQVEIKGIPLVLWDTSGLNEGDKGKVEAKKAVFQLFRLIQSLEKDGVSLLVFCFRGPRVTETTIKNYELFYSAFCQTKVPIVLVATGLEAEGSMDDWWLENKGVFHTQKMKFSGQACITATKGKKSKRETYPYEEEYEESRVKVRKLIVDSLDGVPWKMERIPWFVATVRVLGRKVNAMLGFRLFDCSTKSICEILRDYAGFSDKEARAVKIAASEEGKNEA